jgi:hypothetical protein
MYAWKFKTNAFFHKDRTQTTFVGALKFDPTIIENNTWVRDSSGFRRRVNENCPILGLWVGKNGSFLPMFCDNLRVPSSMSGSPSWTAWILNMEQIVLPETSVTNYHSTLLYLHSLICLHGVCMDNTAVLILNVPVPKYKGYIHVSVAGTVWSHRIATTLAVAHLHVTRHVQ